MVDNRRGSKQEGSRAAAEVASKEDATNGAAKCHQGRSSRTEEADSAATVS